MFRFPRILSRQAVVITLALVVTIPVLAYSAEPMGSTSAAKLERQRISHALSSEHDIYSGH